MNGYSMRKYCLAAQDAGEGDYYNAIGYQNIDKGQLYINDFGGLDGPCINDKDGAQMEDNCNTNC
jgi:hypothetical protein